MGNFIGRCDSESKSDPSEHKNDPWSNTYMTKDEFLARWGRDYPRQNLDNCWQTLRCEKRWDPWSATHVDKQNQMESALQGQRRVGEELGQDACRARALSELLEVACPTPSNSDTTGVSYSKHLCCCVAHLRSDL